MSKKEEKAKEYSKEYEEYNWRLISEQAYEEGWDEALKNQWINTDEQLPKFDDVGNISEKKKYLVRTMYVGMDNEIGYAVSYMRSRYKFSAETDRVKVTHWMPIPSFDNVLKNE